MRRGPYNRCAQSRAEYPDLFEKVSALFAQHDPLHIVYAQNPNEYDFEVGTILPCLEAAVDRADVEAIVHCVFNRWFWVDCLKGLWIDPLIDDVWLVWQEFKASRDAAGLGPA